MGENVTQTECEARRKQCSGVQQDLQEIKKDIVIIKTNWIWIKRIFMGLAALLGIDLGIGVI